MLDKFNISFINLLNIVLIPCFLLASCNSPSLFENAAQIEKIGVVAAVINLEVANLSKRPVSQFQKKEKRQAFLNSQEMVYMLRYFDKLVKKIELKTKKLLPNAIEFSNNPVFRQLPQKKPVPGEVVFPPYKLINIEDKVYSRLLCSGLEVDAVGRLSLSFISIIEEDSILPDIIPGKKYERIQAQIEFKVVDKHGKAFSYYLDGISSKKAVEKELEYQYFSLNSNKKDQYLEALKDIMENI